jgi:hypothetical protein
MKFWRGTPSPAAESLPAIREQKHGRPIEVAEHGKIKDFASTSGQLVGRKSGSEGLFGYLTAVSTGSPKEMISNLDQLLATFGGVECISPEMRSALHQLEPIPERNLRRGVNTQDAGLCVEGEALESSFMARLC